MTWCELKTDHERSALYKSTTKLILWIITLWTLNKLFDYCLLCSIQKLHLIQAPHNIAYANLYVPFCSLCTVYYGRNRAGNLKPKRSMLKAKEKYGRRCISEEWLIKKSIYCSLKHLSMCFSFFFAFDSVSKVHNANFSWLKLLFLSLSLSLFFICIPKSCSNGTTQGYTTTWHFIKNTNCTRLQNSVCPQCISLPT